MGMMKIDQFKKAAGGALEVRLVHGNVNGGCKKDGRLGDRTAHASLDTGRGRRA